MDPTREDKNKVIAEFMTGSIIPKDNYDDRYVLYNSDWAWLMPVVEKIETMKYADCGAIEDISDFPYLRTFYKDPKTGKHFVRINRQQLIEADSKILAVHEACYQFIISIKN